MSAKPTPSAQTDGRVNALYVSGTKVYVGGQFTAVRGAGASSGGTTRNRVAQIDLSTGEVQSWNPNANSTVQTIASGAGLVFLGGNFTTLGGKSAQRLAAVDPTTGALVWKATLNGQVMAIDVANGLVYAGGYFTTANGASRPYLAAFDEKTGVLDTQWRPTANLEVKALAVSADGTRVYVGGDFGQLNGAAAAHLGAVSATTGASLAWASHPAYQVIDMDVAGGDVYVAGAGGGGNFAKFDGISGARDWFGGTNGNAQAIAVIDANVYVGGHFSVYCGHVSGSDTCPGGNTRQKLLALDAATGNLQAWNPGANSDLGIYSLYDGGSWLLAGGDFTRTGATNQEGFARFPSLAGDSSPPRVNQAPKLAVSKGVTLGPATIPTHIAWAATDPSGVCGYTVTRSFASEPYVPVELATPDATSVNQNLTPSAKAYRFQIAATDCAGNKSATSTSDPQVLTVYQNTSSAIHFGGGWTTHKVSGTFGGSHRSTSTANASATLTFNGREVAWVASRSPSRGVTRVYIDGASAGTVNLHQAATVHRRVVFTRAFATTGSHTIKIVCAGTKGHAAIDVDALLVVH